MEAQNHFYGHSAAFAAYCGLSRPRHIAGLVQHGWTAGAPTESHFRDFPALLGRGRSWPTGRRRLLVWSHRSRGWSPAPAVQTVPVGAPWLYLDAVAGARPEPVRDVDRVVILPFHGIETQRIRGDHAALARHWAEVEGAATVCLYAADARDADIVAAYRAAGHRCVLLGERMDPAFLWRLWTMLARAGRVVSNRLSTPVLYAAHLGCDVAVHGDALHLDGEDTSAYDRVRELWPELHGERLDRERARELAADELGVSHLLPPERLREALGWTRPNPLLVTDYWLLAPAQRARVQLGRRRVPVEGSSATGPGPGTAAWLTGALSYLPRPLPRRVPHGSAEPLEVTG